MEEIVETMDGAIFEAAISFPGVWDLLQSADEGKASLKKSLARRYRGVDVRPYGTTAKNMR